jgi:hypothetical protein
MDVIAAKVVDFQRRFGRSRIFPDAEMVPLVGIEPALLAESDFESALVGFPASPQLSHNILCAVFTTG